MPSGQVGVSGYTRRSSTGKVVRVSRYSQKRDLANELRLLGRAPMAAQQGTMAGGRTAPLGKTDTSLKAQQKRVAALRVSVSRARSQAAPEVAKGVPSTLAAVKKAPVTKKSAEARKAERAKSLAAAEKLLKTRGADPEKLKQAQDLLNKSIQKQKNVERAAADRKAARIAAEKKKIEDAKAAEVAARLKEEADKQAILDGFKRDIHPLAVESNAPRTFNYIRNPESSKKYAVNHNFGQASEPAGRYMSIFEPNVKSSVPEGWESGSVTFQSPLIVDFGAEYGNKNNWKELLSSAEGGLTGTELSQKVRDAGFDAIIAKDKYGYSETVDLTAFKPSSETALTTEEKWAAEEYKAAGNNPAYAAINSWNREGTIPSDEYGTHTETDVKDWVKNLDSAIGKQSMGAPTTLYRAIDNADQIFGPSLVPGTVLTDRSFLSTSRENTEAYKSFGETSIVISTPAGMPGLDLEPYNDGYSAGEHETLLPRNLSLTVVSDTVSDTGRRYINVTATLPEDRTVYPLSEPEKKAVADYGGLGYEHINEFLRGDLPRGMAQADIEHNISLLDSAIDKNSTPEDMTVWRGVTVAVLGIGLDNPNRGEPIAEGTRFKDPAFMSTTTDPEVTKLFGSVQMEISVPKGTGHIDMDKQAEASSYASFHSGEAEIILPRGSVLELVSDTGQSKNDHYGYNRVIKMRLLTPEEAAKDYTNVQESNTGNISDNKKVDPNVGDIWATPAPDGGQSGVQSTNDVATGTGGGNSTQGAGSGSPASSTAGTGDSTQASASQASAPQATGTQATGTQGVTPALPPLEQAHQDAINSLDSTSMESFFDSAMSSPEDTIALDSTTGKKIAAIYSGNFKGLNAVVDSINTDGGELGDEIEISGRFLDADGNHAANWTRNFQKNYLDDTHEVHHTQIFMNKDFRGQGVVTAWNRAAEDAYRKMGVSKITLDAVSVGSYAWARAGYDWQRRDDVSLDFVRDDTATEIEKLLDNIEFSANLKLDSGGYAGNTKAYDDAIDQLDRYRFQVSGFRDNPAAKWDDLPTPYDLSQVGWEMGLDRWPGKDGLIGQDWSGEKRLDGPSPAPAHPNLERTPEVEAPRVVPVTVDTPAPFSHTEEQATKLYEESLQTPARISALLDDSANTQGHLAFGKESLDGWKAGLHTSTLSAKHSVSPDGVTSIKWSGDVTNLLGQRVGSFERSVHSDAGVLTGHLDSLKISKDVSVGQAFAQEFNAQAEDAFRAMGAHRVTMDASGAGSFGMARSGYDWNTTTAPGSTPDATRRELYATVSNMLIKASEYSRSDQFKSDSKLSDAKFAKLSATIAKDITSYQSKMTDYAYGRIDTAAIPTPFNVSQIGFVPGVNVWPGKAGMLNEKWSASKLLNPSPEAAAFEDRKAGIQHAVGNVESDFATTAPVKINPHTVADFQNVIASADANKGLEMARSIYGDTVRDLSVVYSPPWFYNDSMRVTGMLKNSDGVLVGAFGRNFSMQNGELVVEHMSLNIDKRFQNQGLASEFNANAENSYRDIGVSKIELQASYTGAYAWARAGYDWLHDTTLNDSEQRSATAANANYLLNRIKGSVDSYEKDGYFVGDTPFLERVKAQIAELKTRFEKFSAGEFGWDDVQLPTPYELSQIGWSEGVSSWPGKEGLLDSGWSGEKRLTKRV